MKKIYLLLTFLLGFVANAQIVNIPNANFKAKLLSSSTSNNVAKNLAGNYFKIDSNNDSNIQVSEALQVSYLDVNNSQIADLTGLLSFANVNSFNCNFNLLNAMTLDIVNGLLDLRFLYCSGNQVQGMNYSGLTNLEVLVVSSAQLTSLNLSGLAALRTLTCSNNQITDLNLVGLPNLQSLTCNNNQLQSLVIDGSPELLSLQCYTNQLTNINVSQFPNLVYLYCYSNQLTSLDVSGLTSLLELRCHNNQITYLDVSDSHDIQTLICNNNQLTSLNIKNGKIELFMNFSNNPNLEYICVDNQQLTDVYDEAIQNGNINCQVNSYCSFTPGGTFYTLEGSNKYDGNQDGCDAIDNVFPNIKFNINSGSVSGSLISDSSGAFSIPLLQGTHTITPIVETPGYFIISPLNLNISFPTANSPFIQNFCISKNGDHNDLEIAILPLNVSQPGFDTNYKIIYKNKGTTSQSGNLSITFDDAVMDFISANTTPTSQAVNTLSWSFSNLVPFESREITLVMNLNSPTETPALIGGSVLNYSASITGLTDETPIDNTASLNQQVVNSFDPNDKTCLEGTTITPDKVGEYVHYLIRFENTGTANAQNVVVKDLIDTTKFDVATLIPIDGSHEFYTRITNTNQVEFIFENIQLPFDDENNNGYVVFKIKTKSDLTVGSSFSNTANIYFDYNFPIVTNTATTTIQALTNQDFEFSDYFELAPNPTKDILNIQTKNDIELSSVSIYNALGQLVIVVPNAKETNSVDVSQLTSGTYFVKVMSDKGSSSSKFIKQ